MFSEGQLIFAILFAITFILVVIISYRKDRNLHRKNFRGVKWVLLTFLIFVIILFIIKYTLKN